MTFWKKLKRECKRVPIVDRCLIVFMALLLLQSTYTLFFSATMQAGAGSLDVIFDSSAAAIFGYFLSSNFIKAPKTTKETTTTHVEFTMTEEKELSPEKQKAEVEQIHMVGTLQILIAASIGLFTLLVLVYARNFMNLTQEASGPIGQMRAFFSGSVGFLLGIPPEGE